MAQCGSTGRPGCALKIKNCLIKNRAKSPHQLWLNHGAMVSTLIIAPCACLACCASELCNYRYRACHQNLHWAIIRVTPRRHDWSSAVSSTQLDESQPWHDCNLYDTKTPSQPARCCRHCPCAEEHQFVRSLAEQWQHSRYWERSVTKWTWNKIRR